MTIGTIEFPLDACVQIFQIVRTDELIWWASTDRQKPP